MEPRFSVIIPVFNGGRYLERTVASVLAQTFPHFELILVDDGSTDGAVDGIRSIQDSRISIFTQPKSGVAIALNRGVAAAVGEFIAFLDADDLWDPEKLRSHVDYFLAHPEADLTFTGLIYIDSNDQPLGLPKRCASGSFSFDQLFVDNVIGSNSVIAARKAAVIAAGAFDPKMLYLADIDFVLRIARLRSLNVCGIPKPLALYRRHPSQLSSSWRLMAAYWAKVVEKCTRLEPVKIARLEPAAQTNMNRYLSYLAFEHGDTATAWSLLWQARRGNSLGFWADLRNWKLGLACSAASFLPSPLFRWLANRAGLRHIVQPAKAS